MLPIISSERINIFFIYRSSGKSTFRNIHRCKIFPLIFINIINFTTIQKYILNSIITPHNIDKLTINNSCMFFSHLIHASSQHNFTFRIYILINSGRRTSSSYQRISIWKCYSSSIIHEIKALRLPLAYS